MHIRYIFITIVTKEERANNYWVGKKHWRRRGGSKYSFYFWSSQKSLKFLNERNKQAKKPLLLILSIQIQPKFHKPAYVAPLLSFRSLWTSLQCHPSLNPLGAKCEMTKPWLFSFMCVSFVIHLFHACLGRAYHSPNRVPVSWHTAGSVTDKPVLMGICFLIGVTANKQHKRLQCSVVTV